jgi:hypothetical protein
VDWDARQGDVSARFELATAADDADVRRLLRSSPMSGAVRLTLEREPDARLAARMEGPILYQTLVGRRGDGSVFGVATRSVRTMHLNGTPCPVGYLGGLRLDASHRGRVRVVLRGFEKLRELHDADRLAPIYLTSILADNAPARRLLEANLQGMPTYRPLGEFVTLVMRTRGRASSIAAVATMDLQQHLRGYQFAPSAEDVFRHVSPDDFVIAADGVGALWDQQSFKQAVVRGYAPWLAVCRPVLNAVASFTRRPRLPAAGHVMRSAFLVTPFGAIEPVVRMLLARARQRGIDYLIAGFDARDERLARLRIAFGGRELRSRLYAVHWDDGAARAASLDDRLLGPEVAWL